MRRIYLIIVMHLLLMACNQIVGYLPENGDYRSSVKIINTSENAGRGTLLVKLYSYAAEFDVQGTDVHISSRPLVPSGRTPEEELLVHDIFRWWILDFDESADPEYVARLVAENDMVEVVEYNTLMVPVASESDMPVPGTRAVVRPHMEMPFNDPELPWQWHYYNDAGLDEDYDNFAAGADVNLFDAWKFTTGDRRVVIGVLDGGVAYDHRDLEANMWVNEAEKNGREGVDDDSNGYVDDVYGYNFVDGKGKIDYDETVMRSHGTHVAGTIAAVNDNGYCGCGIAGGSGNDDGCRIMVCQIFKNGESAPQSDIAAAICYAADNGAVILNNSWSYAAGSYASDALFNSSYSILMDAFRYFERNAGIEGLIDGGVMIFAAGNEGFATPSYPGAYYNHICVTAMGPDFKAGSYTNYGTGVNICAPGGEGNAAGYGTVHKVSSASLESYGYEYMYGTSMAAPHVSGCAALGLSYALKIGRSFTLEEYKGLILTSVHDIDRYQTGEKTVNMGAAGMSDVDMSAYQGKLGGGYIDAHLLLMQIEGTPCIYMSTGSNECCSLDNYFGDSSTSWTYTSVEISDEDMTALGMAESPSVKDGELVVSASKRGSARLAVTAVSGGDAVGGGDNMGGMEVKREFELVVRSKKATNGGWL